MLVDLDGVTFLDCSGIGAILRICGVDELLLIDPTTPPIVASFEA